MAETIADFVARLGFKVEKGEEARFNATLGNLAKTMAGVAASLTAAAAAISATVIAVSKSFDDLYFAAQRTNSTVAGIKSLSYAFSQIGSSGNEAQSALEGLAKAMRTNPGTNTWLNAQGIETAGRKTEEVLSDIFDKFRKQPYHVGYQFAEMIGVSEDTFNKASKQWEAILKYKKEFEATQRSFGVDPDKAAESSNRLMTGFRSLSMAFDALLTKVTVELQPLLQEYLKAISDWFVAHQDQIVRVLEKILRAVGAMAQDFLALAKAMVPVVSQFLKLTESITGENGLKVALEALMIFMTTVWVTKILASLALLARNPAFLALLALAGISYDIFFATAQEKMDIGGKVNDAINGPAGGEANWWTRTQNWVRGKFGMSPVDNKGNPVPGASGSYGGGGASGSWVGGAENGLSGQMVPIYTKDGKKVMVAKEYQAQFQGFINDLEATGYTIKDIGGYANRANVNNPGKKSFHASGMAIDVNPAANPNRSTQTDLPANVGDLAKKWGLGWGMNWNSVKDPMHFSAGEGEGGRRLSPEEIQQRQNQSMVAPPLGGSAARMASIDNKTSITIYGSTDPAGTAANLGGAQKGIAAELIRNAQSAFV